MQRYQKTLSGLSLMNACDDATIAWFEGFDNTIGYQLSGRRLSLDGSAVYRS